MLQGSNITNSASDQSRVSLPNPHLRNEKDYLYHFGLTTDDELVKRFKDVKFICVGGKGSRMKNFAQFIFEKLGHPTNSEFEESSDPNCFTLKNVSKAADRYSLFKVGPVLSVSHGIGSGSASIVLHEMLKLVFYAGCVDVTLIRIGTSGGLGLDPGTVVVTNKALDGLLEPHFQQFICGKIFQHSTIADPKLAEEMCSCAKRIDIEAVTGNTVSANGFYEGQARLDGALCDFTEEDKMNFLRRAHDEHGVRNMEMESACCIATCNRANVKCAVLCVTLVNRLLGDAITNDVTKVKKWESYPQEVVAEFITSRRRKSNI